MTGCSASFLRWSACRWLDKLHDEIGASGLAAAAAIPGLGAAVDQHAAAVRDSTTIGLEATAAIAGLVLLASYARGVLEHARQHDWRPVAQDLNGWASADWISLRLVAVCALANEHGKPATQMPSLKLPPPPLQG